MFIIYATYVCCVCYSILYSWCCVAAGTLTCPNGLIKFYIPLLSYLILIIAQFNPPKFTSFFLYVGILKAILNMSHITYMYMYTWSVYKAKCVSKTCF